MVSEKFFFRTPNHYFPKNPVIQIILRIILWLANFEINLFLIILKFGSQTETNIYSDESPAPEESRQDTPSPSIKPPRDLPK